MHDHHLGSSAYVFYFKIFKRQLFDKPIIQHGVLFFTDLSDQYASGFKQAQAFFIDGPDIFCRGWKIFARMAHTVFSDCFKVNRIFYQHQRVNTMLFQNMAGIDQTNRVAFIFFKAGRI